MLLESTKSLTHSLTHSLLHSTTRKKIHNKTQKPQSWHTRLVSHLDNQVAPKKKMLKKKCRNKNPQIYLQILCPSSLLPRKKKGVGTCKAWYNNEEILPKTPQKTHT
jgi:hypothetical protein